MWDAFRSRGFILRRFPGYLRLVRGRCEVHLRAEGDALVAEIPLARLGPDRPLPDVLLVYLRERNEGHKGPGLFLAEKGFIWYRAAVSVEGVPEETAALAAAMVEAVERLAPKVLNMLR